MRAAAALRYALLPALALAVTTPGQSPRAGRAYGAEHAAGHPTHAMPGMREPMHGHEGMGGHLHPDVPAAYAHAQIPESAWRDPRMLPRGKEIYLARCAVCHGERGDGRGPAGLALSPPPPDLGDPDMVAEMRGSYWFWRVSEGGAVEPFRSQGSAMPAWKAALSVEDRWAVIAYEHTFSGHAGPHVTSEHPEMAAH